MKKAFLIALCCAALCIFASGVFAQNKGDLSAKQDKDKGKITQSLEEVASGLDASLRSEGYEGVRLAVMAFAENGKLAREKELGAAVQAELHSKLSKKGWQMVERARLADILKEIELAQTGILEDAKAAEVAELAGADVLIIGSVSEVGDRYLINARAVSQKNATTIASEQVEVSSAYLIALSSEAVVLRTRWDSTYRSMVAPGWGQFYNEQPVKGGVFVGLEVLTIAAVLGLHFGGEKVADDYNNLGPDSSQKTFDDKRRLKERLHDWRNYMIGAVVGVWAVNVIDAAVNGKTYKRTELGVVGSGGGEISPAVLAMPDEEPVPGFSLSLEF